MGINDNYFRVQQLYRNKTHSLSSVQHNTTPLIQGNKILIIIHKPLNSGRIKLFSGNTNNNHHIFVGIPNNKMCHQTHMNHTSVTEQQSTNRQLNKPSYLVSTTLSILTTKDINNNDKNINRIANSVNSIGIKSIGINNNFININNK